MTVAFGLRLMCMLFLEWRKNEVRTITTEHLHQLIFSRSFRHRPLAYEIIFLFRNCTLSNHYNHTFALTYFSPKRSRSRSTIQPSLTITRSHNIINDIAFTSIDAFLFLLSWKIVNIFLHCLFLLTQQPSIGEGIWYF